MKDHVHNYRIAAGNRMVVDRKTGEVVKREFHGKDCKGDSKIKDAGTRDQEEQVVQYKGFVIGKCPKCTSDMTGFPYPGCEVKKTGRYFYKECTACTYYVEIFKRGNKFTEMEGG
jgi:hypothetical protein